jgi:hypothetical protein
MVLPSATKGGREKESGVVGFAGAEAAGDALDEDFGLGCDEDGHGTYSNSLSR